MNSPRETEVGFVKDVACDWLIRLLITPEGDWTEY